MRFANLFLYYYQERASHVNGYSLSLGISDWGKGYGLAESDFTYENQATSGSQMLKVA